MTPFPATCFTTMPVVAAPLCRGEWFPMTCQTDTPTERRGYNTNRFYFTSSSKLSLWLWNSGTDRLEHG